LPIPRFGTRLKDALAEKIKTKGLKEDKGSYKVYNPYYLMVSERWPEAKLGLFQVKDYWGDSADLLLISTSCEELKEWISRGREKLGRDPVVVMPMPGTGNGRLPLREVMPYVEKLPDCVEVWQYADQEEFKLPEGDDLALLLEGDKMTYLGNLSKLLDMTLKEISDLCEEHGFYITADDDRERVQRYLLIESWQENGKDMSGAWHIARNKMRALVTKE
jgi:hypothetical protein